MSRWMLRLPWIAGALFVAASLTWISRDTRIRHEAFRDYSVYNASAKGMSLAWRYLESTGRSVQALARPVERAFLPADGVLLRIRPEGNVDVPLEVIRGTPLLVQLFFVYAALPLYGLRLSAVEFPKKSGHRVKGHADCSYSAGLT